jgi:carbamoylphosphate synthase small subunit
MIINPVNTVNRTSLDRFLNNFFLVTVLIIDTRATVFTFNKKGIGSNVGAVFTTDTSDLIDVNRFLAQ